MLIRSHQGIVRAWKLRGQYYALAQSLTYCVTQASVSLPEPGRVSRGSSKFCHSVTLSKFSTCLPTPSKQPDTHPLLMREKNSTATLEPRLAVFIKLTRHFPDDQAISLPGIYPRQMKVQIHRNAKLSIVVLSITAKKTWKQPKCPPIED